MRGDHPRPGPCRSPLSLSCRGRGARVTDDRRLSVCLSFDFDATSVWISSTDNLAMISRGEFGAVAVPRLLDLLRRREALATFFIPGHTALAYPDLVRAIDASGHEIGHHGWVHENPAELDRRAETEVFRRGLGALAEVAGVTPTGFRSPAGDYSENTIEILLEHGFRYDSTFSGSDFHPYYVRRGDKVSKTEAYEFGEPCELVEMPISWMLDDFPLFEFEVGWSYSQHPPSHVREIWQKEFDWAYENEAGGAVTIIMHPQVIGRGSRLTMLDELIQYMASHQGVVFESLGAYQERWRAANPLAEYRRRGSIHAPLRGSG
ncbi:MAG: polysaccharide deacetylase [Actinobacteria bacterium]|nr:polysaccharide deacetylase [Actinomycetota bacterium]